MRGLLPTTNETLAGELLDDLLRHLWLKMPVHDPDTMFVWACGKCPYFNHGVICTKCGAGREDRDQRFPPQGRIAA